VKTDEDNRGHIENYIGSRYQKKVTRFNAGGANQREILQVARIRAQFLKTREKQQRGLLRGGAITETAEEGTV